jgi:hypothetical protein
MNLLKKIFINFLYLKEFLLINIYFFFENKKIVIFYFSSPGYRENLEYFYKFINNNKLSIYTIFRQKKNDNFENRSKVFFLGQRWVRFLKKVDIVISPSVCLDFKTTINIYYHHDILDSPLGSSRMIYYNLNNYRKVDFILVANSIVQNYLQYNLLKIFKKKQIPKIEIVGYNKINKLSKRKAQKQILIAPTNRNAFPSGTSILDQVYLKRLIIELRKEYKNYKIVLRPHPNNREFDMRFLSSFDVSIDNSSDYEKVYSESALMITDFSGTAFTYALRFKRPVIFLIRKKIYKIPGFLTSYYRSNLKFIGKASSIKNLNKDIRYLLCNNYQKRIYSFRKKVFNFDQNKALKTFLEKYINNF